MNTTTDQKLDTQNSLLKWILAGVGTGIVGLAMFVGSYINSSLSYRDKGEDYLRNDIKKSLDDNGKTQASIVKVLEQQTQILGEIRDDQKKFPAISASSPP
jgi:hypothetical protein